MTLVAADVANEQLTYSELLSSGRNSEDFGGFQQGDERADILYADKPVQPVIVRL